jgi:CRP-like cAMP-binding protein
MWDEGVDSDASQYIQSLPNSLQVGLAQEMHRSILSKISIFADLPSEAIFFLVQNWARSVFMPKDVIVWEGDVIDRLYIVLRGGVTVSVRHGYTRLVIAELKEGAFFGETAMLASDPIAQQHTVRTNGFCEVLFLTKGMYEEMMLKYQLNTSLGYILAAESKKREIRMRWKKAIAQVRAVNRLRRASTAPTDLDDSTRKMLAEIGRES